MGEEQAAGPAWGAIVLFFFIAGFFIALGIWVAESLLGLVTGSNAEKGKQWMDKMAMKLGNMLEEKDNETVGEKAATKQAKTYKLNPSSPRD